MVASSRKSGMAFARSSARALVLVASGEVHEEMVDAAATIESSVESVERHVTQLEQLPARIGDLTS
jgi:hypothetical protein